MLAAAAAAAATIWLTTAWLLDVADDAKAGTERAKVRVDAVRTGLAAGAGAGAATGLMLAFRRQRHQELATALGELDAAERRVTELYNASAEQLGSDKAPVRLTALYTLERLANGNPTHRQTIVNIICAYLRMPFTPLARPSPPDPEKENRERARRNTARYRAARARRPAADGPPAPAGLDPHEELQVRLTAQRLLHAHLQPVADVHWQGISLDLSGATLIDFALTRCHLHTADLTHATLSGDARFGEATFTGDAWFNRAIFAGSAGFDAATFTRDAWFGGTTFTGNARFDRATFTENAMFDGATFNRNAWFVAATFIRDALFFRTIFARSALFRGATFAGDTRFNGATFAASAGFDAATFTRDAWFGGTTFTGDVWFDGTTFTENTMFDGAAFSGDAVFAQTAFTSVVTLGDASFSRGVDLEAATVADAGLGHRVPAGWRIEPTEEGGGGFVRLAAPAPPAV
ncbi:pentapeptide repeat-containing protein [Actinomadura graeca]|uniref:Pentapeptide repeat-containing protein n=1 Tax=Actinomadura graeca TaxID=2750812 RepID=A0ABX8R4I3_9ACTN|nr:pentapeptide repeat-containing protein [Actinomadura graeca]QXJ25738.1 pentapeptide repeat-containing protein [Actinomadura graeca]